MDMKSLTRPEDNMVRFTQYLLPNGRKRLIETPVPPDVKEKADKIVAAGLALEIEMLSNGTISMTIADRKKGVDVAHRLCPNGPGVIENVNALIREFDLGEYLGSISEDSDGESA